MKKQLEIFMDFWKDRIYVLALSFTAVFSYGFMVTHHAVGIDDTPYSLYFEQGLSAVVGRWVMFLLNKFLNISDFAPFLTDLAGVLIFMVAVTVWCTLLYSVVGDRVPRYAYTFFACIFLSCPLISEVYVYYLHDAVATGYLCTGLSLGMFFKGMEGWKVQNKKPDKTEKKQCLMLLMGSGLLLWIALGCYESFMMVWLMGVCILLMLERMCGTKNRIFVTVAVAGVIVLGSVVLRSIIINSLTEIYQLHDMTKYTRSIVEKLNWVTEPDAYSNFGMAVKRTYVMYGVFACAYYPILVFVLASAVNVAVAVWQSFKRRDIWISLLLAAGYVASFLLMVIEGKATYYRAAQFLPVLCGLGAFLVVYIMSSMVKYFREKGRNRIAGGTNKIVILVLLIVLWNQCVDMNKWFYLDYQKYEAAKQTIHSVAYELEKNFDTSKPIVFTGIYEIPTTITQPAYVGYGSREYAFMLAMTQWWDENLMGKFSRPQGVMVAQMPTLSVIEWGRTAFETDQEIICFFWMHGYDYQPLLDVDYTEIELASLELPSFPQEGSIVDMGSYINVHF